MNVRRSRAAGQDYIGDKTYKGDPVDAGEMEGAANDIAECDRSLPVEARQGLNADYVYDGMLAALKKLGYVRDRQCWRRRAL